MKRDSFTSDGGRFQRWGRFISELFACRYRIVRSPATWSDIDVRLYHYRDRSGPEIDVILETSDGRIGAVEVKAAASVTDDDARTLRMFRDRVGAGFTNGVIL